MLTPADVGATLRGRVFATNAAGIDYLSSRPTAVVAPVADYSRLAYVELLDDERAETVTDFVARALAFFVQRALPCHTGSTTTSVGRSN